MLLSKSLLRTAVASLLAFGAARADERPNIIVIFMDDMGYNDVGVQTYPGPPNQYPVSGPTPNPNTANPVPSPNQARFLTPNIDSLASQGLTMPQFYATPLCSLSRASLLTGRYSKRISVNAVFFPSSANPEQVKGLNTSEVTLPELLRQSGYATGMVGKWHLGYVPSKHEPFQMMPTRHGFHEFFGNPHSNDMASFNLIQDETVIESDFNSPTEQSQLTWRYTEAALDFIERNSAGQKPFFLYLAQISTHIPCWPSNTTFTNADGTTWPQFMGSSGVSHYYDLVKEIDHSVGRVLDKLDNLGISNNTLVIFTSDNGPWLTLGSMNNAERSVGCAYPLKDGKFSTWEGGVRVPFFARWTGQIAPGTVLNQQVGSVTDILPTIAGLAGATVPTDRTIDGINLWPVWSGQSSNISRSVAHFNGATLQSLTKDGWKLRSGSQLYNVADLNDQEATDQAASQPAILADLQATQTAISNSLTAETQPLGEFTSYEVELSADEIQVPEGGTAGLQISLSANPGKTVTVSVARYSGDSDLTVSAGASIVFDTTNWATSQTVTLTAAADADALHSGATFRVTSDDIAAVREVFAFEVDDEAPLPVSVTRVWPKLQAVGIANSTVKLVAEVDADVGGTLNPAGTVYTWQKVSGPGTVTFSAPASQETTVTFSMNGLYQIRMIANHPNADGPGVDEFDVYVGIAPPPVNGVESSAVLSYDATADTDGDSNWENLITPGAGDWALTSSITRTASDPAPSVSFIDAAWNFLGGITGAGGTSSNLNAYSTGDASFEIWFKPASLPTSAQQVLWESGGDIGTSFVLNGSTLSFVVDDGSGNAANGAIASATLSPLPANDGFVHAVGVISLADDEIRLYLDGSLADTEAIPSVSDWCGTSASGLGKVDDTPIASPPGGSATVDFDPSGELAAQFHGGVYSESASGGLNSSVGVNLGNINVCSFDGTQSVSFPAAGYTVGSSVTVGSYLKLSSFGTATGTSGQVLRLGLTNGGTDNFNTMPFGTIEMTNTSTGAAKFVIRDNNDGQPAFTPFNLSLNSWYYFEVTFTRAGTVGISYDFKIYPSASDGTLGAQLASATASNVVGTGILNGTQLDGAVYGGLKGNSSTAAGVIDNFRVTTVGTGGTSTVNFNSLGGNDLLTQPIEEFAGQIAIFRFYNQAINTTQISDLAGGPDLANIGPVVSAGADVSGACGAPIALGGSASDDGKPIPATLASLWRQLSGPDAATPFPALASFANSSAPATSATFGVPGSYTLRLEADDGEIKVCDDALATITPLTYASWASGISFPPGQGDPEDNPDHDRFVNLWEWALGYDPLIPNPTDPWFQYSTGTNGGNRVITLQLDVRRDRLPAISFEESSNLQSWNPATTSTATLISDTLMRWTSTTESPLNDPRRFVRAKVSQ